MSLTDSPPKSEAGDDTLIVAAPPGKRPAMPRTGEPIDLVLGGDSVLRSGFADSLQAMPFEEAPAQAVMAPAPRGLPLIGGMSVARQQRLLGGLIVLGALGFVIALWTILSDTSRHAAQARGASQATSHANTLLRSSAQAMLGLPQAFPEMRESAQRLSGIVASMVTGGADLGALPADLSEVLKPLSPLAERAERNATTIGSQQKALVEASQAMRLIGRQAVDMGSAVQALQSTKVQAGAAAGEMAAVGQLGMLVNRVLLTSNGVRALNGLTPEASAQVGKDLQAVRDTLDALLQGGGAFQLLPAKDAAVRERLEQLLAQTDAALKLAGPLGAAGLLGIGAAYTAHSAILNDSNPLIDGLQRLQDSLGTQGGPNTMMLALLVGSVLAMALGGFGFLRVNIADQSGRARTAEAMRQQAEQQERDVKRINNANQTAILRLMDELQNVAAGDLTQQATVTEDVTGAIADSVNYTVEELRNLVAQVQGTATRVAETTELVDQTSTELLAASSEQLREIRDTGESVLQMASRINDVSSNAQETADVARQSLKAAESGLVAVQNTINGMNAIRDQIQDTSKRIKRLGESSQEIGEITELISDITEQTNVLALNAAIQAASAGEAGRGFSVVAEEVQRLAERSADATRQIAALVKAIQTDTQDAVAAMERSTQGVVEGARLSDTAGAALVGIDRVTRELSDLILHISEKASSEATQANVVAQNIQHIFAVTEQASDGTRSTAQMVRELSHIAEELRESVARFKIA